MPAARPKPPADDSAGITEEPATLSSGSDIEVVEDAPEPKVMARFVGVDPVLAHIDGVAVIVEPGDPIPVSAEQLECNPDFQPWED